MKTIPAFHRAIISGLILGLAWMLMGAASAPRDWWIALANDRIEQVRDGLRRGVDPNVRTPDGMPALMQAVRDDAWKSFDLLLAQPGIDVNATNALDETPLMYVAVVGQTERAARLIALGAQVNRLGWTPLHYAASRGHLDTVQLLLRHAAIVNAPGPDGTTPLMMAAFSGDESVVRALVAAGADATARNLEDMTPADWARRRRHEQLATKLEDLAVRIQASRDAQRTQVQPGNAPTPADTLPESRRQPDRPAVEPIDAGESSTSQPQTSTSQYFDLERFEREDNDPW